MLQFGKYGRWLIWWPEKVSASPRFTKRELIAPYWSIVDVSSPFASNGTDRSVVYYHEYHLCNADNKTLQIIQRANSDVRRFQTNPSFPKFSASWVLVVTWVRLYPHSYNPSFRKYKMQLVSRLDKLFFRVMTCISLVKENVYVAFVCMLIFNFCF